MFNIVFQYREHTVGSRIFHWRTYLKVITSSDLLITRLTTQTSSPTPSPRKRKNQRPKAAVAKGNPKPTSESSEHDEFVIFFWNFWCVFQYNFIGYNFRRMGYQMQLLSLLPRSEKEWSTSSMVCYPKIILSVHARRIHTPGSGNATTSPLVKKRGRMKGPRYVKIFRRYTLNNIGCCSPEDYIQNKSLALIQIPSEPVRSRRMDRG